MTLAYKINEKIDVVVRRGASFNFDMACSEAYDSALYCFGVDEAGHINNVEGAMRSACAVVVEFAGYRHTGGMGGHSYEYLFKAWVSESDGDDLCGPHFEIAKHDHADKEFYIRGPLDLTVDYDDVDHEKVDLLAEKVVRVLNENWRPEYHEEVVREARKRRKCPNCGAPPGSNPLCVTCRDE